jgi:O-antigen ligase
MSVIRRGRGPEVIVAALGGLLFGLTAVVAATSHSQMITLATVAELGGLIALAVGDVRRVLLVAIVFDIPLSWDKNFGYNSSAASLGALGGLSISITTIALAVLYAHWAIERSRARPAMPRAWWRPALPLLAYVGVETASVAVASNKALAVDEVALLAQTLLLFVYVVSTVRTRSDITLLAVALVSSLLLESLLIIGVRVTGRQISFAGLASHQTAKTSATDLRLGGTIGSPNSAAAFLAMLLPLAAAMLVAPVSRAVRRLCIVTLPIGIMALILTEARAGWVALTVSILVLGFVAIRRGLLPIRLAIAIILVIALAAAPFWGTIVHRASGNDNGSAASRLSMATLAMHMIRDHPFLGVGANNYAVNIPNYAGPQFDGTFIYTVHDKYLLVWSEAGIVALIAFAWFMCSTVARGWRAARSADPMIGPLALGLTAAIVGQLPEMAVDPFQARPDVQLLWLVAGLLSAMLALSLRESNSARGPAVSRGAGQLPRDLVSARHPRTIQLQPVRDLR